LVTIKYGEDSNATLISVLGDSRDIVVWKEALRIYGFMNKFLKLDMDNYPLCDGIYHQAFTIDPKSTKVFDDAFTITDEKIGIHITDLSYLNISIKNNVIYKSTVIDGERKSVYNFSLGNIMTLSKDKIKPVITMWYDINTKDVTFEKCLIRVSDHLTYDNVTDETLNILKLITDKYDIDEKYYYSDTSESKMIVFKLMYIYSLNFYRNMYKNMGWTVIKSESDQPFEIINRDINDDDTFEFMTSPIRCIYPGIIQGIVYQNKSLDESSRLISKLGSIKDRYMISYSGINTLSIIGEAKKISDLPQYMMVSRVYNSSVVILMNDMRYIVRKTNIYVSSSINSSDESVDEISTDSSDEFMLLEDSMINISEMSKWKVLIRYKPSSRCILDSIVMDIVG